MFASSHYKKATTFSLHDTIFELSLLTMLNIQELLISLPWAIIRSCAVEVFTLSHALSHALSSVVGTNHKSHN